MKENMFDAAITGIVDDLMRGNRDTILDAYCQGKALLVDPHSGAITAVDIYKTKEELEE